jgi:hypothetical protein
MAKRYQRGNQNPYIKEGQPHNDQKIPKGYWLPLWYLLAIVWLSFFDIRILITPLVSFGHCVVVLLWYTDSDYPFGVFWPLCGCPSLIYGFWLPLWYLLAIVWLSFFDIRFWLPLWYLLVIVWLSFFDIRILITPLVSFGYCLVVLFWYSDSDYSFVEEILYIRRVWRYQRGNQNPYIKEGLTKTT